MGSADSAAGDAFGVNGVEERLVEDAAVEVLEEEEEEEVASAPPAPRSGGAAALTTKWSPLSFQPAPR